MTDIAATAAVVPNVAVASQWQLMWWAFRRHKLAMAGAIVTLILYIIAAVPGFFAINDPNQQNARAAYHPPEALHFIDRDAAGDLSLGPWYHPDKLARDPDTLAAIYKPDETRKAEKKVYIAAVATDAMGIGAWTKPGRGQIPYTWQVLMNWAWMNPPALQYFYEDKSPNDYFIGGLSGPGYMYPKAIPADKWPALTAVGRDLMQRLDLRVLEIMDYSEGNRHVGNTDLPKEVVDRYYAQYPDAIGFINGYGTARTFDLRGQRPLISYDYYLDVNRPVDEAAADLEELIQLNPQRPYFLLLHIRESNTVEKVTQILHRLSEPVEVVPLDVFLKLAADAKTYQTHYQQPSDPVDHNP